MKMKKCLKIKKIEQPDKILKIVKKILDLNKQNQIWKGLKILTPDQMLCRLPITLAQLNAGNNSEKYRILCNDQRIYKTNL